MKTKLILVSAILAATFAAGAHAAEGYVTDSQNQVVKSGSGLCWRTGFWTPGMATAECDPDLAPKPKAHTAATGGMTSVAPTPPTPVNRSLSLSADGLFAFGKAALLPKGKKKLDEVVAQLQGRSADQITVIGHTDRLGSKAANDRLSQKRADAVKAYLVAKKIDGRIIKTEGHGSAEPVTAANQCPGKGGAKVIACLQPDRRVEIRVSGLK